MTQIEWRDIAGDYICTGENPCEAVAAAAVAVAAPVSLGRRDAGVGRATRRAEKERRAFPASLSLFSLPTPPPL